MRSRMSVLLLLAIVAISFADLSITPYGLVQYRLRARVNSEFSDESSVTALDYFNTFSYYAGMKVGIDQQLSLQFQIGNDWVATENVIWETNRTPYSEDVLDLPGKGLYVHLAYAQWNPGFMYLEAGAVPVPSYGPLDLLERSLNTGSYNAAAFVSWIVGTNNSLIGLKVGAPVLKGDTKLDLNLFSTIVDARSTTLSDDQGIIKSPNSNPSSVLFVFDAPLSAGPLSITPQMAGIVYRNYNQAREAGDHEVTGGLTAAYKFGKNIVSAKAAYAMVDNEGSRIGQTIRTADTLAVADPYDNRGLLAGLNSKIAAGPGAFSLEFTYSYAENKESESKSDVDYCYTDIRYTWNVHPNFSIAPRYRNFTVVNPEGSDVRMTVENRPELLLTAKF